MPCRACGHHNEPAARFCNQCGAPLGACPQCGTQNPPGSRFCQGCGGSVAGPAGGYTPRHLVEQVLRRGAGVEGERKHVTVLFADVAGFTALAERLDPEDVHAIMDACFAILLDEIHRFGGTVNQFTGDGVMSLFGAPVAHEDHARLALNAALCIQRAMGDFERRLRHERGLDFRMRIGLNSGVVIVGRIGDDLRSDYTAVGDTTNLAARMLTLAEPGGVVVTEHTYRLAQSYFAFTPLGEVAVKGRQQPVQAYRVAGLGHVRTRMQAAATRGLTTFVGRERELETLTGAFAATAAGAGQVVAISGEAGIGKSRLVHEFLGRLAGTNTLVCEAACAPYTRGFPYYPFIKIVRDYCEIGDDDDESRIREKARRK